MSSRILLIVLVLMIASILSIVFLQGGGSGSDKQPSEGQLLSTPSRMTQEQ